MKKCVVLVGPPGSGKSTMASSVYGGYDYVNQDSQGKQHKDVFANAIAHGRNVIVDRMNFDRKQRSRWIEAAKNAGYEVSIFVLQVPRSVCLDRMNARKDHPTIKAPDVANMALDTFFGKYEKPQSDEAECILFFGHDSTNPPCVVVDLDGTLCNIDHRLHWVKHENKKERRWDKFFRAIPGDVPNQWCAELVDSLSLNFPVVFASGRPVDYEEETRRWLQSYGFVDQHLYMRPKGDFRQDYIVKETILDFEILTRYNPLFFVDDRKQVVDMWRGRGFVCLQCDEGNF